MKTLIVTILSLASLFPALASAPNGSQAWLQLYNGSANENDAAVSVAIDSPDNVIVTGYSGNTGYVTIKYSSAGVPLWSNRFVGFAHTGDSPAAVAVDANDNVIVTGASGGPDTVFMTEYATIKYSSGGLALWTNYYLGSFDNQPCALKVDSGNNVIVTGYSYVDGIDKHYATIKYSSTGTGLWTNIYIGPASVRDVPSAMALDSDNNVIVTGVSVTGNSSFYASVKYSSAGVPLWTNFYAGSSNGSDYGAAVATDSSNNVIVTGASSGIGGADFATIKYLGTGVPLWTNRYNGPANGYDQAYAVAVDSNDNIIVAGGSDGASSEDYLTIKYSSAGTMIWAKRYDDPWNGQDLAAAIGVGKSNEVIVTGYSGGSNFSLPDCATIAYSSAGVPLWTNRYNGPGDDMDVANGIAVDHNGNVIIVGFASNTNGALLNYDFLTIKYVSYIVPPVLTAFSMSNGTFQLMVEEPVPAASVVIEASRDLTSWLPVWTNAASTNVLFYGDTKATNFDRRFYRAREQW